MAIDPDIQAFDARDRLGDVTALTEVAARGGPPMSLLLVDRPVRTGHPDERQVAR